MSHSKYISLDYTLPVENSLGEGVIWDHRLQCLYWTDILQNKLYSWTFSEELCTYPCPEGLCSFGLTRDPQWLICAFSNGFAFFNPYSQQQKWIKKLSFPKPKMRLNDGRVDRQGRFWAGSMDSVATNKSEAEGILYRMDLDGTVDEQIAQIQIANSLCWDPQGSRIYFADSPSHCIQTAEFDGVTGKIGLLQDFAYTPENAFPDGACIDSEGCLWSAQWGSSTVKRYDPRGNVLFCLDLPCKQPTCISFAGPELNYLCVTSACQDLHPQQLTSTDGSLFIFSTHYRGLNEEICKMALPDSIKDA